MKAYRIKYTVYDHTKGDFITEYRYFTQYHRALAFAERAVRAMYNDEHRLTAVPEEMPWLIGKYNIIEIFIEN